MDILLKPTSAPVYDKVISDGGCKDYPRETSEEGKLPECVKEEDLKQGLQLCSCGKHVVWFFSGEAGMEMLYYYILRVWDEFRVCRLASGKEWHVVECAKPDGNLKRGLHLILETVDQHRPDQLSPEELSELRLLAFQLADELATSKHKWRVDFNGPAAAVRAHFHAHIKLPAGDDKLARLTG